MMERAHAAYISGLDTASDPSEPLSPAWFGAVREACARTGPVPSCDRLLLEWTIEDVPGAVTVVWLFGVWQRHWVCWAATTPWAAPDVATTTVFESVSFTRAVRFGADLNPPTQPWPPFGTSELALPTVILDALGGQGSDLPATIPATPLPIAPAAGPSPNLPPPGTTPTPPAGVGVPPPPPITPAGWHPDPYGRAQLRYWDGSSWTSHAADAAGQPIDDPI